MKSTYELYPERACAEPVGLGDDSKNSECGDLEEAFDHAENKEVAD